MADFSHNNLANNSKFDFLKQVGGWNDDDDNSFIYSDSPYNIAEMSCTYMSELEIAQKFSNYSKPSVLSINIQSLSAKFSDLLSLIKFLQTNNCAPEVICLQEIWRILGNKFFYIDGYHPLEFKCRRENVQGGGAGIYVRKDLCFTKNIELSVFSDLILESIFVNVMFSNKKFTIGSLYRPGTQHLTLSAKDQFSQFCELFSAISDNINSKNKLAYIFGDFNLDCLKHGTCLSLLNYRLLTYYFPMGSCKLSQNLLDVR